MYVPAGDVSTNNTHANMASKQENRQTGKQASKQSSGAEQAGGTDSEQCLVSKALGGVTRMTRHKIRVKNPIASRLGESSE